MPNDRFPTLHDLIANLTEYLSLTPEQQFRVTAKIKRYVHEEKAGVYHRYFLYSQGMGIYEGEGEERKLVGHEKAKDEFLNNILNEKYRQHKILATACPDESLVTWNIGTHKFRQEKPSCTGCSKTVGDDGYVSMHSNGNRITLCKPCAMKSGDWERVFGEENE